MDYLVSFILFLNDLPYLPQPLIDFEQRLATLNYCPTLREDFGWQIESDLIDVDHTKVNVQSTCSPEIICYRK